MGKEKKITIKIWMQIWESKMPRLKRRTNIVNRIVKLAGDEIKCEREEELSFLEKKKKKIRSPKKSPRNTCLNPTEHENRKPSKQQKKKKNTSITSSKTSKFVFPCSTHPLPPLQTSPPPPAPFHFPVWHVSFFFFPGRGIGWLVISSSPKMHEHGSLRKSSSPTDSSHPWKVEALEMVCVADLIPGITHTYKKKNTRHRRGESSRVALLLSLTCPTLCGFFFSNFTRGMDDDK